MAAGLGPKRTDFEEAMARKERDSDGAGVDNADATSHGGATKCGGETSRCADQGAEDRVATGKDVPDVPPKINYSREASPDDPDYFVLEVLGESPKYRQEVRPGVVTWPYV